MRSARGEAASAFGDGTVFLERFVTDPRHVEVQILGDTAGHVVHLFERECSIQRRYQKIVEECPSPAVGEDLRAALAAAAVAAGEAIGYIGAGTVEFVLDRDGSFFFLEVNTRLQVEHPVTEEVTGLDLVELQLRIAEGEPLPPEVRGARISGHAIEVRLYAEDVPAGFVPATGVLHRFAIPAAPGVRVDTGFRDGSVVSPHYDAMLAKVIAHGRTRAEAARRLARALERAEIHGVTTNRDLLTAILREPDFLAGAHRHRLPHPPRPGRAQQRPPGSRRCTRWSRRWPGRPCTGPGRRFWARCRPAGVMSSPRRSASPTPPAAPTMPSPTASSGTRSARQSTTSHCRRSSVRPGRTGSISRLAASAGSTGCTRPATSPTSTRATARAHCPRCRGSATPEKTALAGSLLAPMPGLVLRVLAEVGTVVTAGQPLLVLEAMKMEQTVTAPADGVVAELRAKAGEQVSTGQVLAVSRPGEVTIMPVDMTALADDLTAESAVTRGLIAGLDEAGWHTPTPGGRLGHHRPDQPPGLLRRGHRAIRDPASGVPGRTGRGRGRRRHRPRHDRRPVP